MSQKVPQIKEIVWAKLTGYPWWPAEIVNVFPKDKNKNGEVVVNFIGSNTHASMPYNKVASYKENYAKYSYKPAISLAYSIMSANKIYSKKSTFERIFFKINFLEEQAEWLAATSNKIKQKKLNLKENKEFIDFLCPAHENEGKKTKPKNVAEKPAKNTKETRSTKPQKVEKKLKKEDEKHVVKKTIGTRLSGKRQVSEQNAEQSTEPASNTQIDLQKKTPRTCQMLIRSILKDIKIVLKEKHLAKNELVQELIECLNEISHRKISIKTLMETQFGVSVQELYDFAKDDPVFASTKNASKAVLHSIKRSACLELFGYDIEEKKEKEVSKTPEKQEETIAGEPEKFKIKSTTSLKRKKENIEPQDVQETRRNTENKTIENQEKAHDELENILNPKLARQIISKLKAQLLSVFYNITNIIIVKYKINR